MRRPATFLTQGEFVVNSGAYTKCESPATAAPVIATAALLSAADDAATAIILPNTESMPAPAPAPEGGRASVVVDPGVLSQAFATSWGQGRVLVFGHSAFLDDTSSNANPV